MLFPTRHWLALLACLILSFGLIQYPNVNAASILTVPNDYPTIQSAVDAASAGDTIKLLLGTYEEQVIIGKSLAIIGSGSSSTVIKAPSSVVPDSFGFTEIIEINNHATVEMQGVTVSGPGASDCGSLTAGIRVLEDATLDLYSSTVTHIRNNPIRGDCGREGTGILVGTAQSQGSQVGHATIDHVTINDFQFTGITVVTEGSTATVTHSEITGQGPSSQVPSLGSVVAAFGGSAVITHNKISGNQCNLPDCGPDILNQGQSTGVFALFAGPGTVISHNDISDNDIGIGFIGGDCCKDDHNTLTNNRYFGIVIFDGDTTSSHDKMNGGNVGVVVVALSVDVTGTLEYDKITGTSVQDVQEISISPYTATAIIKK